MRSLRVGCPSGVSHIDLCPQWRSPARFVDQRAEGIACEADEYVIQGGFPGRVRRRVALPDALAVALAVGRAVICQKLVEDQGFEIHQAVRPVTRMVSRKAALRCMGYAERFAGMEIKLA